ncbi:hypothetical protein NE865_06081 [Phthorimaea operculella]|nr:hypothetical protein NE865_06081 [Phthorimaea operculella]
MIRQTAFSGLSSTHAGSEPDVSKIAENTGPIKRPRESCCEDRFTEFKEEIKIMIKDLGDAQNITLKTLVDDVAIIKAQNISIKSTNEQIEQSVKFLSDQFDSMSKRIDFLEKERKEHLLHISSLETKVEDMQRSLKSASVELRNLPLEPGKENKPELTNLVQRTCKVLAVDIHSNDIKDVYRIKGKSGLSTVVVDLMRTTTKQEVVNKAKNFNKQHPNDRLNSTHLGLAGRPVPIYVSESLTNNGRRLFYLARTLASSAGYKYCWTSNGRVFLRKNEESPHMEVKSEEDLAPLKNSK